MAINFPNNPAVNDTFTVGGTTFTFTGVKWETSAVVEISSDTTPSLGGDLDAATHNINNVGVITATTFSGNLTGNVTGTATTATVATNAQGLTGDPSIQVTNATVLGNLDVQGTTTTIDTAITEVDSLNVEGSVGIGTTNPGTKLEVHSDTIPRINTVFQGSKHFGMSVGGSGCGFVLTDGHFMTVTHQPYADRGTDNNLTERLRITSDANMGLGVTPVYSGVFGGSQRVLHIGGTTAPGLRIQSSTSNQGDFIIQAGNSGGATYLSNLSNNADTVFYTTSGGSTTEKVRISSDGNVTATGTISDSIGDVRRLDIVSSSVDLTLSAASHAGRLIRMTSTNRTFTIPSGSFSSGDMITIFHVGTGNMTIAQGSSVTLYNAADGATGNRTLAAKGMVTIACTDGASNEFVISGSQLT